MAVDGYGAGYKSAPQGYTKTATRDRDVNKDGQPDNEGGRKRNNRFAASPNFQNTMGELISNTIGNYLSDTDDASAPSRGATAATAADMGIATYFTNMLSDASAGRALDLASGIGDIQDRDSERSADRAYRFGSMYEDDNLDRSLRFMSAAGETENKRIQSQSAANMRETVVEGEQDRLGTAADGEQERKTYDFQDRIAARESGRQRKASRGLARSF